MINLLWVIVKIVLKMVYQYRISAPHSYAQILFHFTVVGC